jgi:hypothetical protein
MIRIHTFALAAGLAVLSALAPTAEAQAPRGPGGGYGPGSGPGPGGGPGGGDVAAATQAGMAGLGMGAGQGTHLIMILLAPSVQKELTLTEEQKTKVYNLARNSRQRGRGMNRQMGGGAGNIDPQAMMKLRQESDKSIAQILDPTQKERFDQIVLQAEGPLAVARPDIAAKLKLNDAQNEYVQGIMMQIRQEVVMAVQQGAANGQINAGQLRGMGAQLKQNAVQEVGKVINAKQKAAFNKMLGAPFDLKTLESETANSNPDAPGGANTPADTGQAKEAPGGGANAETGDAKAKEATPAARKKGRTKAGTNP